MPAIDEIEDIMEEAHADFDDFHGKLYWSCQPAYVYNDFSFEYWKRTTALGSYKNQDDNITGVYYTDDVNRARATKAEYESGEFKEVINSGSSSFGTQNGKIQISTINWGSTTDGYVKGDYVNNSTIDYEENFPGNKSRLDRARVRVVRKDATLESSGQ